MKQVTITYHPIPFLRFTRTATGTYPEKWSEVTAGQLKAIAETYVGDIPNHRFLNALTGIKPRILKRLDPYQQYKLLELVEFVNKLEPYNAFIIGSIQLNGKPFAAPNPMLKGMSFGRFIFADSFFRNYNETSNPEELNRMLAALYLPAGRKFKENYIEKHAPLMAAVKPATREAIRLNYMLVFEWLMDVYPMVFPREQPETRNPAGADLQSVPKTRDPRAWVKIFESLVGDDIVNQNKYSSLPVHTVFRYFTRNIKENMKSRKKK
jgi:hypothetical protein